MFDDPFFSSHGVGSSMGSMGGCIDGNMGGGFSSFSSFSSSSVGAGGQRRSVTTRTLNGRTTKVTETSTMGQNGQWRTTRQEEDLGAGGGNMGMLGGDPFGGFFGGSGFWGNMGMLGS